MKKLVFVSLIFGAIVNVAHANEFLDTATVLSVEPVYESHSSEPHEECHKEIVGYRDVGSDRSLGGSIIGGLVGGILGHQFGKGTGKDVATAAGAIAGTIVGDRIDNDGATQHGYREPIYEERCHITYKTTKDFSGWNVVYQYHGHRMQGFMRTKPGKTIRVRVTVEPEDDLSTYD